MSPVDIWRNISAFIIIIIIMLLLLWSISYDMQYSRQAMSRNLLGQI